MSTEIKKTDPDVLFCVAREAAPGRGEDSWCYSCRGGETLIGVFDGSGGIGAQQYPGYGGHTGAYVASRAVSGAVQAWFESGKTEPVEKPVEMALDICKRYANLPQGNAGVKIKGSLRKSFPTTMAALTIFADSDRVHARCFWAGDSRCYLCDGDGLHQLSVDDVGSTDAMENLSDDGALKNVVNASVPYSIHTCSFIAAKPCFFVAATDGCFGYLRSPMHFEYLLIDTLCASDSIEAWKTAMDRRLYECAGDDYSLCVAGYGYPSFKAMKKAFASRREQVRRRYIECDGEPQVLWLSYKEKYESFMTDR